MVSVTISVPNDIRAKMNSFEEMNWSGYVRKCILSKVEELEWKDKMLEKLKVDEQINEFAVDLIRKGRSKRK
tara:strand:+ start:645 stop:860 length:216 start_codon:yes stop_codon:yes gene_type:complete